jgi:PAS domain S-box-containing protein
MMPLPDRRAIISPPIVVRDIPEQKLAEEKFRLAVEWCSSGMVMVDASGRMVLVNSEIERMFGYHRNELIGQSVEILVPENLRRTHAHHCDTFVAAPETRRMGTFRDLFARRKDGTEFPVDVGLNPIHSGDEVLVLAVVVDITERKRIERLKDEFVSTVSHELRTPLTSICGSLGLLMANVGGDLPASASRLLAIALKNSQRLARLINDILDIEKIESGTVAFVLKRIEVDALVEQAIESNRGFAETYGARLSFTANSALDYVRADSDRLFQVITNLLSNAIKFSPRGGEVVVAIENRTDIVRISVTDHGPGIPADFKPHMFEKFAQADSSDARQKGGTGLGLSIVKGIVLRLGGEVSFDSVPGNTVFHVDIPSFTAQDAA